MPIFFFSSEERSKSARYLFKNLKYFLFSLSFQWYFCLLVRLSFWGWCHQFTKRTKQDMTYLACLTLLTSSPHLPPQKTRTSLIACMTLAIIFILISDAFRNIYSLSFIILPPSLISNPESFAMELILLSLFFREKTKKVFRVFAKLILNIILTLFIDLFKI